MYRSGSLRRTAPFVILFAILLTTGSSSVRAQDSGPKTVYDIDATEDGSYYSLRNNRLVSAADITDDNWDIHLQGTAIRVNGQARLLERSFDLVERAPESGYATDDPATGPAIPSANHEGWYDYDPNSHLVMTIPDRTIALILSDGTYAKMEVLSYYEGQMPDVGSPRFYTFRFVHQADGTRNFR